jgi:hypothetical protein
MAQHVLPPSACGADDRDGGDGSKLAVHLYWKWRQGGDYGQLQKRVINSRRAIAAGPVFLVCNRYDFVPVDCGRPVTQESVQVVRLKRELTALPFLGTSAHQAL